MEQPRKLDFDLSIEKKWCDKGKQVKVPSRKDATPLSKVKVIIMFFYARFIAGNEEKLVSELVF